VERMKKHRRGGKVVGYEGKKAKTYVEPKEAKAGGLGELEKAGSTPMPKQADYDSTAQWSAALRKWREQQRSARTAATALAKNSK